MTAAGRLTRRQVVAGLGAGGALLATGTLAACARGVTSRSSGAGDPAPGPYVPPAELASDGGRLDVTLVAAAAAVPYGEGTRWALTYNGATPGPTLRVRPGDLLTITLENRLDQPTNLHTHGLHVSPEGDSDNVFVKIEPGQSRTYRYQIPSGHASGTFWYHPHLHGLVAPQVFGGLAGTIIIEDELDQLPALAVATERVLVLSDPNIGDTSGVLDLAMMQQMAGREGSTILVNGLFQPRLQTRTGTLEHWRLINASASRYYALRLDGLQLNQIATDGSRLPEPQAIGEVVLAPAERAEVLVAVVAAGSRNLVTRAVDRGTMGMAAPRGGGSMGGMGMGMGGMGMGGMGMGGMGMGGSAGPALDAGDTVVATLDAAGDDRDAPPLPAPLRAGATPAAEPVSRTREVTLSMGVGMGSGMGMGSGAGGSGGQFLIDGRTFDPNRVDIDARLGSTEEWVLTNTSVMDHPFHLHVWPFQVVRSDGGVAPGWKDTVNVPAGGSVRIRIAFRDFAGKTVYHCHILDHEDLGMMGVIEARAA